jgi:hypothetical protein
MPRGHPRDPRKEQFWRDHLHRWQRTGGSIRAYCRRHDLAEASFHAWRRTLARRDRGTAATPAVTFVPIHVRHEAAPAPLELVLGNGWLLRIPAGCAAETLRAVLALAAEGPSC